MIVRTILAVGIVCCMGASTLFAQHTYPDFTGDSLYILAGDASRLDVFSLRNELDVINRGSPRGYRVVVLDSATGQPVLRQNP